MESAIYSALLIIAAALAYVLGRRHGVTAMANALLEEEACNPAVPFETIEDFVVAKTRGVPVEQVRAEKIGHSYERD